MFGISFIDFIELIIQHDSEMTNDVCLSQIRIQLTIRSIDETPNSKNEKKKFSCRLGWIKEVIRSLQFQIQSYRSGSIAIDVFSRCCQEGMRILQLIAGVCEMNLCAHHGNQSSASFL